VHAFFFGTSKTPLFGVYHPPRGARVRDHGVVLCYPYGQEYMRGHRAFRQLALLLTRAGFHVLRFDYSATGDSGGESHEVDLDQWLEDLDAAIDELRETADVTALSLVGARLGAAVAARLAAGRDDIDNVVCWDPVVRGQDYLDEILSGATLEPPARAGDGPTAVLAGVNGFPVTRRMRDQILELDLCAAATAVPAAMHVVVSEERPEYAALERAVHARSDSASYRHIPARGNWNEVDNFGSALLPQEVIQGIVQWLDGKVTA
jgi:uncharacterized protein